MKLKGKRSVWSVSVKKDFKYFKKTGKVRKTYTDIMATFQMFHAREIARILLIIL